MLCTLCHQDLPEKDFYPSSLKKGNHQCKKCLYINYGKRAIDKYQGSIKNAPDKMFNSLFGGYIVTIINHVKPNEYKYIIKGTDGYMIQTNDLEFFKKKFNEICQEQRPEK